MLLDGRLLDMRAMKIICNALEASEHKRDELRSRDSSGLRRKTDASHQALKPGVGTQAIKPGLDIEICQPAGTIVHRFFKPFERQVFLATACVG